MKFERLTVPDWKLPTSVAFNRRVHEQIDPLWERRCPDGTEVPPAAWWDALQEAIAGAGGLEDVAAISVASQQHGMVALTGTGT